MLRADCHVHSNFSSDSNTDPKDNILQAIMLGMDTFYFTDHHDIDFVAQEPEGLDFQLDTSNYIMDIQSLKNKYKSKIDIRLGVELGFMNHLQLKIHDYVTATNWDFVIGSSHLVHGLDPYYPSFYEGRTEKAAYRDYFESILENVQAIKDYDVYGHLDYVVRYGPNKANQYYFEDYSDVFEAILKTIILDGKGIEINTGGLYKGLSFPHPHKSILKLYKELGGEIITVGSDAHTPDKIGYGFEYAKSVLQESGFKYYTLFKERNPQFICL